MKTRLSSVWCIVIGSTALVTAAANCGGSSGACGVQPCGGNVVGSWTATSACANRATLNQEFLTVISIYCPQAKLGAVSLRPSGSMTLATDLTYSASVVMSATVNFVVPADCLSGQSCALLTALLQSTVGMSGIQSVTCAGSSSCTCTLGIMQAIEDSSGTYSTGGTALTLYATAGTATGGGSGDYCVQGKALHLVQVNTTMPMATIDSDVVFTKQ